MPTKVPEGATPEELQGKRAAEAWSSMVYKERVQGNVSVAATMAFADQMAPLILLVPALSENAKGQQECSERFEIVKGAVVRGSVTYRWRADKKAIEEVALEGQAECRRLHSWDPGTKQIKIVNIDSRGTSWTACIGRDGDIWPWTVDGHLPDGTKMEGKGVDTFQADGKFTVDGTIQSAPASFIAATNLWTRSTPSGITS